MGFCVASGLRLGDSGRGVQWHTSPEATTPQGARNAKKGEPLGATR